MAPSGPELAAAGSSHARLRGAIVGLGHVALNGHAPGWRRSGQFEIVAGVDPSAERRSLFENAAAPATAAPSLADLPGAFDFVDICTPPALHFEGIKSALERGCHVLCEKPLVLSKAELRCVSELAAERDRAVVTVHNWRFAPLCRQISEIIARGALGMVRRCSWDVYRKAPSVTTALDNWRLDPNLSGGGILVDHGWHAFYLVLGWLGLRPLTVQAALDNRQGGVSGIEDTARITVEFVPVSGRPPVAEVTLTWAADKRDHRGVIEGNLGSLHIEDSSLLLRRSDGVRRVFSFPVALSGGSHHPEWFDDVVAEFAAEIGDPGRRGQNLAVARDCLRLIECSRASSLRRQPVPFDE